MIAVGICVGFLPHNFNPARIFMGDAGAMFLGLLMAATTITVGGRSRRPFSGQTYFFFAPLFIPLLHPRRADHRHRVLVRAPRAHAASRSPRPTRSTSTTGSCGSGHGPRRGVVILWLWTALLSGFVLVPTYTSQGNPPELRRRG